VIQLNLFIGFDQKYLVQGVLGFLKRLFFLFFHRDMICLVVFNKNNSNTQSYDEQKQFKKYLIPITNCFHFFESFGINWY